MCPLLLYVGVDVWVNVRGVRGEDQRGGGECLLLGMGLKIEEENARKGAQES